MDEQLVCSDTLSQTGVSRSLDTVCKRTVPGDAYGENEEGAGEPVGQLAESWYQCHHFSGEGRGGCLV